MTAAAARETLPDIIATLGIAGVLDGLIDFAKEQTETALTGDALARFRAASDHRRLVEVREKVYN